MQYHKYNVFPDAFINEKVCIGLSLSVDSLFTQTEQLFNENVY